MTAAQSVDAVSDEFLKLQARANDNGTITTDVTDITLFPYEDKWVLRYTLGDPFDNWFAREHINVSTKFEGLPALLERHKPPFLTADEITTIDINLNPDEPFSFRSPTPEEQMNDISIEINGRTGTMSEIHTIGEYYAQKDHDMNEMQEKIETEMLLYRDINNADTPEYRIKKVETPDESTVRLILDGFESKNTLPVEIPLPMADKIQQSPVTDFINALGCGKIADLEHQHVYLYEQQDKTIGCDTRFETYGVSATALETKKQSFLSRLLG